MRMVLFFDLPVETSEHKKAYRKFVKNLKKNGFFMLQYSVYSKLCYDNQVVSSTKKYLNTIKPKEGIISLLTITEKQFNSIEYILGDFVSPVLATDDRLTYL